MSISTTTKNNTQNISDEILKLDGLLKSGLITKEQIEHRYILAVLTNELFTYSVDLFIIIVAWLVGGNEIARGVKIARWPAASLSRRRGVFTHRRPEHLEIRRVHGVVGRDRPAARARVCGTSAELRGRRSPRLRQMWWFVR